MKKALGAILVLLLLNTINCIGQDKGKIEQLGIKSPINFLDKKFFNHYDLDANTQFPQFWYKDKKIGEFIVMYLAKDRQLQKEWENYDSKNGIFVEAEITENQSKQLNQLIKNKLEPNLNSYYIITEYVEPKYFLYGKDTDYKYPYIKTFYLYDQENKSWNSLYKIVISSGMDEKNTTKLERLNELINFREKNINQKTPIVKTNKTSRTSNGNKDYPVNGTWRTNCESENLLSKLSIQNKTASIEVWFNQMYLGMTEINRYDSEKGIAYKLSGKPDDLGNYAAKIDYWKDLVNDKPIAYIKVIDDSTIYFYWYGLYNSKTKKREFTDCELQNEVEGNKKQIILRKCKE